MILLTTLGLLGIAGYVYRHPIMDMLFDDDLEE